MDIFDMEFPELPSIAPDLMFEEDPNADRNIFTTLTAQDKESLLNFVLDDHAYAKPYPILSTANNKCVTPQTILKLHPNDVSIKKKCKRNQSKYQAHGSEDDDEIDVVTVDEPADFVVKYDKTKAHNGMNEVESYLNSLWKDVDKDDDEKITRGSWSKEQARLFDVVYKLINNYQLAKLAYVKNTNEPVLRKLALDKATHRIRKAFGSVLWNPKHIVWLHGVMIDGLGSSLFLCYLEILQSLKRKAPILFERVLLFDRAASEKELTAGLPNLGVRLKKSWDPSTGLQSKVTVEKFPTTPFLIMVPSGPNIPHQSTKRNRFWNNQLMNFGKVFPINVPAYRTLEGYVIKHYLEHCISAIRSKITEFRNRFPERHVVLVGWGVGSLISLKVANLYKVDAIVCLGFPCNGIDGDASEEYWKGLTKIECPVLFVLGTHATSNSVTATEKLREQMKTQTNLILIESADEMLRLTKSQKKALGMTQNMIDKLIQDEIYLFLKSVLFKPKPVVTTLPKGPITGKKRKKKIDSAEKGETKKKRKGDAKSSTLLPNNSEALLLPPLDVSISSVSSVPLVGSQGLLTTGSVSTSIPVTQLQSESLTSFTSNIIQQTVTTSDVVVSTTKEVSKRNIVKEPKEKIKRTKAPKKAAVPRNVGMPPGSQKFTSTVAAHQFPVASNKGGVQQPASFQRVPAGSFVLSGASGQIRLQGGANILYLQQATSGATHLLSTPMINSSSGAFTAVISSNLVVSTPPKINIVPSSNFKFGPANPTITPQNKGLSAIISSGGCGNLVITSTSPLANSNITSSIDTLPNKTVDVMTSSMPTSCNVAPSTMASSPSVATSASSTIMTHLSANDLRYLASLIAKHSNSRPNSPMPSSLAGPLVFKADEKTLLKTGREVTDSPKLPVSATVVSEGGNYMNKSSLISILDKKVALNSPIPSSKKAVQPPSLAQRVASIQQKDTVTKMKNPRLKTSKLVSTTVNMPMGHIITANTTKNSLTPPSSKVLHKVPVTLTIPISRLPSTLNFSSASALSKSIINVPVLSSYLSQEKLIATSTKPSGSSPCSRTIVTNPSSAKKSPIMIGNIPVCSSPVKMSNMSVFPSSRSPTTTSSRSNSGGIFITKTPFSSAISTFKSPVKSRNPSPITLHLPSQGSLKDPKVLRKAVSDVKVVGVLSQQSKSQIPSLVNLSTLRSISNPSSPLRSPSNDSLHGDITPEELSPIQPREQGDVGDLKSDDRKKNSPLKSSIMAAIGDNVKPLTPPSIPSSTLLAASAPKDVNVIGRSNVSGKVGTGAFLGKLFVGPKSIVDPVRVKAGPNAPVHVALGQNIDAEGYDDEDDDDDDDEDDESDVDFAIFPAVGSPNSNTPVNKPVLFDPIKHSNITKIVYAPNTVNDTKSNVTTSTSVFSRNILDIARAKLRETQFRCVDGILSTNNVSEPRSSSEEHVSPGDSRLRFEPLKISGSRAKLTSVLSARDNKFDDSNSSNVLMTSNTNVIVNSIVDTKTLSAEMGIKTDEFNPNDVTIQGNKPTLKQLPSSCPAPIMNFTLVCDPDTSRSTVDKLGGESSSDAVLMPTIETNVSTDDLDKKSKDGKYTTTKTNGLSSHEIKETPFSSIQYKSVFSGPVSNETSMPGVENKGATFATIDGKKGSFPSVSFKGTCLSNSKTRGVPFSNNDSKGTFLGNIESRGDSKGMHICSRGNRPTTSNIENKGMEAKSMLFNIEKKGTPLENIETSTSSYSENPQMTKLLGKPTKASKQVHEYNMIVEEEPQPYITRSGRVMRSKYSIQYIDELDRKKTPKKRRLSSSTNQDSMPSSKKNKGISDVSPTSAVTLENLVEAAKLIKKESDTLVNGKSVVMPEKVINHVNIDSTTNIAATAMLELLSGDTKCVKSNNIGDEMTETMLNNSNVHKHNKLEDGGSKDVDIGVVLNANAETSVSISNGLSHPDSTNVELPVSRIASVVIDKLNVNTILRNPSDPSLPSLAPILKVPSEIQSIPVANLEHIPVNDSVECNTDISDVVTREGRNRGGSSPIPPLAAIQDKCVESDLNLPIDLLDSMNRPEFNEEPSHSENKNEKNREQCSNMSFTNDKVKPVISAICENLVEPTQQTDKVGCDSSVPLAEENLPTLAIIQDKSTVDNPVVPCTKILVDQNIVLSPVVVTSTEVCPDYVPVSNEETPNFPCEIIQPSENESLSDERSKQMESKSNTTDPCGDKRVNLPIRLPSSSPPALAVIQNNKSHTKSKFDEPNIIVADNSSVVNTLGDIANVNSLPPLAAIQINTPESESLSQPSNPKLILDTDLGSTRETSKNNPFVEKDITELDISAEEKSQQSLPVLTIDGSTDDTKSDRRIECDNAMNEDDSKQELGEGKGIE